jgi:hypothetical protein
MLIARNRQGGRKQGQSSIGNFEVCPGINGLHVSQGWLEYLGAKDMRVVLKVCLQTGRAGRCFPGCYFEVNEG